MKKHRSLHAVVFLMLMLHLTGCYNWQPVTVTPRQLFEEGQPGRIRVVQADGVELELRDPRVEADSLVARLTGNRTGDVSFALSDITVVEAPGLHAVRTAGAVVLAVYVPLVMILGRLFGGTGCGPGCPGADGARQLPLRSAWAPI